MNEIIWKDVVGFEGLYKVSNNGIVKSVKRKVSRKDGYYNVVPERVLKSAYNKKGYVEVWLYKDGERKVKFVHQLVAKAFIPNPEGLLEVNHIDENKGNNNVENLEWITRQDNIRYSQSKPVKATEIATGNVKYYWAMADVKNDGFIITNVCKVCQGIRKSCNGWRFEYV